MESSLTFSPSSQRSTFTTLLLGVGASTKLDLVGLSFQIPIAGSGAVGLAITPPLMRTAALSLYACPTSIGGRMTGTATTNMLFQSKDAAPSASGRTRQ